MTNIKKELWYLIAFFVSLISVISIFSYAAHWSLSPARGKAYGYIYYQEKNGIFQLDTICWKDSPYIKDCELFDPAGKQYEPGRYIIEYKCSRFVWAWEKPSECSVVNATKLGGLGATQ